MDAGDVLALSQEIAELGAVIHHDCADAPNALDRTMQLACKHVPGCEHASVTVVRNGQGKTAASSDEVALLADLLQYTLGEGPCLRAASEDGNYLLFDVQTETRWPHYAQALAEQTPIRSVLSFDLVAGHAAALNLYGEAPGAFSDDAIDTAAVFAAHTSGLVALAQVQTQASNLANAVQSNREIGMAVGVLMAQRKVPQEQAFELLRRASQNLHRKLREVAYEVVETGALPG